MASQPSTYRQPSPYQQSSTYQQLSPYRGRFAPSPSGRLHLGSALIAYGSYLCAKAQGGTYVVRIEDLDRPRCPKANTPIMLAELKALGLISDEPELIQTEHESRYLEAITQVPSAYRCNCTRAQLKQRPCPCEKLNLAPALHQSIRVDLSAALASHPYFIDDNFGKVLQADYRHELNPSLVLKRSDDIIAYNLAVVVDDHYQGITEVVRGADMLSATFLQLALYDLLGYQAPRFCHLPLVLEAKSGQKFSKQNHAPALLDLMTPLEALRLCLHLLNVIPEKGIDALIKERLSAFRQNQGKVAPPKSDKDEEKLHDLLTYAVSCFDPSSLPKQALML